MGSSLRSYSIYFCYGPNSWITVITIPSPPPPPPLQKKLSNMWWSTFKNGAAQHCSVTEIALKLPFLCEQKRPHHVVWFRVGAKAIRHGVSKTSLSESRSSTKRHVISRINNITCLAVTTLLPCTSIPNASDNLLAGVELNSSPR